MLPATTAPAAPNAMNSRIIPSPAIPPRPGRLPTSTSTLTTGPGIDSMWSKREESTFAPSGSPAVHSAVTANPTSVPRSGNRQRSSGPEMTGIGRPETLHTL